jgi:ubiquinone/menaquinone biosynthesis C-methylase UbiE
MYHYGMLSASPYEFGYPWWMTWGHLVPLVLFGLLALAAWQLRWKTWIVVASGALALWGLAGFIIMHQVLDVRRPLPLPTSRFLPGGSGRVLDMGAGSGRATLMVLLNRPNTSVVALDIYSGYWGIDDNTPERLKRNAAAAGAANRVDVQVADMRELPFPDASFDGAVSSFALDHLRRDDVPRALGEAVRVLRPGGQILIMNVNVDAWIRVAIPAVPGHGYFGREQDTNRWRAMLTEAGFDVIEQGTQPGTHYFLGQKRAASAGR